MYNHALATLALAEAYSLSGDARLVEPVQGGVAFLTSAQQPEGGWDYWPHTTHRNDSSITGWAVMALKENNCGQVRGPVQMNFARSIEPVVPLEVTITRMAVATEREAKSQEGDNRTMGRKSIVPYGLYKAEGYISAHLAKQTGFSEEDLELLWQALINMFDHDRSAARGKMAARVLVVFKHDNALGNAPAHTLLSRLKATRDATDKPARAYTDYKVNLDEANMPKGITVQKLLWS
jgi:CRISPR-associated protein Csd2